MDKKIIDKIISITLFLTAILLTVYYVRRIPLPMKIIVLGFDALIFYWVYTVWEFNKKKDGNTRKES